MSTCRASRSTSTPARASFVEPLPAYLDRAKHGWLLINCSDEGQAGLRHHLFSHVVGCPNRLRGSFRVIGLGGSSQPYYHAVEFVSVNYVLHQPCCLAKANRQDPSGQGVHSTGVANLPALPGDSLHLAKGLHGTYANGFIQVEKAVDRGRSFASGRGVSSGHGGSSPARE